jgi:hypothetical protein
LACPNGAARTRKIFQCCAPAFGARVPASGTEIITGHIDLLIDNVPNSIGQFRALAVTDSARDPRASRCAEVWHKDPAGMRAAMAADMAKWGPVERAMGLKLEQILVRSHFPGRQVFHLA